MYAKEIAIQSVRIEARGLANVWWSMAWDKAQTDAEADRCRLMSRLWEYVALCADGWAPGGNPDALAAEVGLKASLNGLLCLANALVRHKSEIAYKVDHWMLPGGKIDVESRVIEMVREPMVLVETYEFKTRG